MVLSLQGALLAKLVSFRKIASSDTEAIKAY